MKKTITFALSLLLSTAAIHTKPIPKIKTTNVGIVTQKEIVKKYILEKRAQLGWIVDGTEGVAGAIATQFGFQGVTKEGILLAKAVFEQRSDNDIRTLVEQHITIDQAKYVNTYFTDMQKSTSKKQAITIMHKKNAAEKLHRPNMTEAELLAQYRTAKNQNDQVEKEKIEEAFVLGLWGLSHFEQNTK